MIFSCVQVFCNSMDCSCQTPVSLGFPRQEYWSGLPFPSPRYLPDMGIKPKSPLLAGRVFSTEPPRKPVQPYLLHYTLFSCSVWFNGFFRHVLKSITALSHFRISTHPTLFILQVCLQMPLPYATALSLYFIMHSFEWVAARGPAPAGRDSIGEGQDR